MPTLGSNLSIERSVIFSHPVAGDLTILTGIDEIAWGYGLNTANFPTYAGEVVQILSCYIDNLTIQGTFQEYMQMESFYSYFLTYLKVATQGDRANPKPGQTSYNQVPMTMKYPHRGWEFKIIPTAVPNYRKGRDVVAPGWRLEAFVVDDGGDVEDLKDLIIRESEIKAAVGSGDPDFSENFGLKGVIKFTDENPFSDPWTDRGQAFDPTDSLNAIGDYYTKLLPSYMSGDFDAIFSGIGSKPSFNSSRADAATGKGNIDTDKQIRAAADKAK